MKDRIGVVTYYSNYGSVLQAYATKKLLEDNGFECDIICREYRGKGKIGYYLKAAWLELRFSLRDIGYLMFNFRRLFKLLPKDPLSESSSNELGLFILSELQPVRCTDKILKKIGSGDRYSAFITGSDQVWNGFRPYKPWFFLEFAPPEKRIALSPSIGTNRIEKYNRGNFRRSISQIEYLSVREESGREMIKELTGRTALRIADPTVMLTAEEWRKLASEKGAKKFRNYIFAHFLSQPADEAIRLLKSEAKNKKVLIFAYFYEELKNIENIEFVDGDPWDYISLIDNADLVCTDSFHSTMFSINLDTPFCVFKRNYGAYADQSSRVVSLLNIYDLSDRLAPVDPQNLYSKPNRAEKLSEERESVTLFLLNAVNTVIGKNTETAPDEFPHLKNDDDCSGCAVCEAVCPANAISMVNRKFGYRLPEIDKNKCLKCKLCEEICKKSFDRSGKKPDKPVSYIAYAKDPAVQMGSASGGAFACLANSILDSGGVVFGACLSFVNGEAVVKHRLIDNKEELPLILKSKYVQSDCSEIYSTVKEYLSHNKLLMFSGTSCQVDGLYRYLGKRDIPNLFTVDLVCHGVPGAELFNDYIKYISKKYNSEVVSFDFRDKKTNRIDYTESITFRNGKIISIPFYKSPYYLMFLQMESYREGCYHCKFASINKPADITLGDFFGAEQSCPDAFESLGECRKNGVSLVMVNTDNGGSLLSRQDMELVEVPLKATMAAHEQLCQPSGYTDMRLSLIDKYSNGFKNVVQAYRLETCLRPIYMRIKGKLRP